MMANRFRSLVLAAALVGGTAFAAPFASVPSVGQLGKSVAVQGGGFAPGTVVTVRMSGPNAKLSSVGAAVVDAGGGLTYDAMPAQTGAHKVTLLDAAGNVLVDNLKLQVSQ